MSIISRYNVWGIFWGRVIVTIHIESVVAYHGNIFYTISYLKNPHLNSISFSLNGAAVYYSTNWVSWCCISFFKYLPGVPFPGNFYLPLDTIYVNILKCTMVEDNYTMLFLFYNFGIYLEAQQIQDSCLCCAIGKRFIHTFCRVYILQEHRVLRSYTQGFLVDYNF